MSLWHIMFHMLDLLSYGIECVAVSVLLSALICCILLFMSARTSRNGNFSIPTIFSGAFLFLILAYQFANLYCAVQCKSAVISVFDKVEVAVGVASYPAIAQLVENMGEEYPLVSMLVNPDIIEGVDNSAITLKNAVLDEINGFMLRRIWWSIGAIIVFGSLIFILAGQSSGGRRTRKRRVAVSHRYYREDFN